ncbi:MAG: hypothetical protein MK179_13275 [Pirellulaceae bacterium]|nr:hypothetical protein [Pirellulaceae bacterium]
MRQSTVLSVLLSVAMKMLISCTAPIQHTVQKLVMDDSVANELVHDDRPETSSWWGIS